MNNYQEPVKQGQTNTPAVISLIAGILSLVTLLLALCMPCLLLISLIIGMVGTILGFVAKKKIDESQGTQSGRGLAVAGLVTNLIGGIGSIVIIIIYVVIIGISAGAGTLIPILEGNYY